MPDGNLTREIDFNTLRHDFPALAQEINGKPLIYLDSAASAQKPRQVIEAIHNFLMHDYSNVHRGVHTLSQRATGLYEGLRDKVAAFIKAPSRENIVITRNATEAFNLVMHGLGRARFQAGDEVILTQMEHHANIVPWQMLAREKGIVIRVAPISENGVLLVDELAKLISAKTKLIGLCHCSNVLGTVNPVKKITRLAHDHGVPVVIDGSQAAVHMPVDMQDIGADLYIFTGHKLYGPTGIGILYGTMEMLDRMAPFQGGGDMIEQVSFEGTSFKDAPYKFEAGTPPILEGVGLSAAIDYVQAIGMERIAAYERDISDYAHAVFDTLKGVTVYGRAPGKAGILSFAVEGVHAHDLGTVLDRMGIAVRVGKHCAEPLMDFLNIDATARASLALYNNRADIDALVEGIDKARSLFA